MTPDILEQYCADQLRALLDGYDRILDNLPAMAERAPNDDMAVLFTDLRDTVGNRRARLLGVFEALDITPLKLHNPVSGAIFSKLGHVDALPRGSELIDLVQFGVLLQAKFQELAELGLTAAWLHDLEHHRPADELLGMAREARDLVDEFLRMAPDVPLEESSIQGPLHPPPPS